MRDLTAALICRDRANHRKATEKSRNWGSGAVAALQLRMAQTCLSGVGHHFLDVLVLQRFKEAACCGAAAGVWNNAKVLGAAAKAKSAQPCNPQRRNARCRRVSREVTRQAGGCVDPS